MWRSGFEAGEWMLQQRESLTLTAEDFQAFLAALAAPREPTAALQRAVRRRAQEVDRPPSSGTPIGPDS
jgi:uncharacterized protein (DUF1778 family)